jgi:protein-tyrosine-phosphatase
VTFRHTHESTLATVDRIDGPRILVLCTANQCRSPMAEGILADLLARRGVEAVVDSAGLLPGGAPAAPHTVELLGERGIDLSEHRSRSIHDPAVRLGATDLLVTMERKHVREAVVAEPALRHRSFTLVDLVRRSQLTSPRRRGESVGAWAERVGEGRSAVHYLGTGDDEIADPIGRSRAHYNDTAKQLDFFLDLLVEHAFPVSSDEQLVR